MPGLLYHDTMKSGYRGPRPKSILHVATGYGITGLVDYFWWDAEPLEASIH